MSDNTEVERLKSVIIEHVAKDVLILTDQVEKLTDQLKQVGGMLELLQGNTEKQFDLAGKKIIDFLVEQEKHLAELADSRTKQISLTVSDNVEQILNNKFGVYQQTVDKALEKFQAVNVEAVNSLNTAYKEAEARINSAGTGGKTKSKYGLLEWAIVAMLGINAATGIVLFVTSRI